VIIVAMLDATNGNKRATTQSTGASQAAALAQEPIRNTEPSPGSKALNNASVIEMLRSGISPAVVVAAIKNSRGSYDTSAKALLELKQGTNQSKSSNSSGRITDELTTSFKQLEKSVVTV
jgi:hypothetical protein